MLRIAVKYGVSEALSAVPGLDVWDFHIRQHEDEGALRLEIRYRYDPELCFGALVREREPGAVAVAVDPGDDTVELISEDAPLIEVDAVPGEFARQETFEVAGLDELYAAITEWTARLENEHRAAAKTRVLSAQKEALAQIAGHLDGVANRPIPHSAARAYCERLERVEAVVAELRAGDDEERAERIADDFGSLRARVDLFGERDFLYAVLVRLVKHLWDAENLRIVEGSNRATEVLFDRPPATEPALDRVKAAMGEPQHS